MKSNIYNITNISIKNPPLPIDQETVQENFVKKLQENLFQSFKQGFLKNSELNQDLKDKISKIYDNTINCKDFKIEVTKEGIVKLDIYKPLKAMRKALEKLI